MQMGKRECVSLHIYIYIYIYIKMVSQLVDSFEETNL